MHKITNIILIFLNKIKNNEEFYRIIKNINWLFLENITRSIIGLILFSLMARYLGPQQFGKINYATSFVLLFSALSTLGLDSIIVRNLISKPENKQVYMGTSFFLKLIGSLLMVFLSFLLISKLEPEDALLKYFVFIISIGYIFKSFDNIDFLFQSKIKAKYSVISRSIAFVTTAILKIFFIKTNQPAILFVIMLSIEALLSSIILVYFYLKKEGINSLKWKVDISILRNLLSDSWPIMIAGVASIIYMKIDQIMIGKMIGDANLGIYYSAVKLSETWYFIPTIVGASVFPAIVNAKRKSNELYLSRLQILFDYSTWFAIIISILISLFSKNIIDIFYGQQYSLAAPILSVHIWSGIFVFLGIIASKWVIVENYTKNALERTIFGAIINVFLNLFLIEKYGIMGAAISTLISYSFVNFFSLALYKKTRICFFMQLKSFDIFRILKKIKLFRLTFKKIKIFCLILNYEARNFFLRKKVLYNNKVKKGLIVSLTTYKKRIKYAHISIESIFNQSLMPSQVVLWLSREEFDKKNIPIKIKRLESRGLTIQYVDENIKSYKKLFYALKKYKKSTIITIDDDTIYLKNFLKNLYDAHKVNKNCVVANRCSKILKINNSAISDYSKWPAITNPEKSFSFFPTGVGGILYPPNILNDEVMNKKLFLNLCEDADDIWFKAMSLLNEKMVFCTGKTDDFISIKKLQNNALWKKNVLENGNNKKINLIFNYYKLHKYLE